MINYLMPLVLITLSSFMHPLHVSVCEVKYNEGEQLLEFTQHVFIDDLEQAIRKELNEPHLDITNPDQGRSTDELVKSYLKDHFKVAVNGEGVSIHYLGHEIENDAIYCYLEIGNVSSIKSIRITNTVNMNVFEDQTNLVHVEVDDDIRSMKLSGNRRVDTLSYQ